MTQGQTIVVVSSLATQAAVTLLLGALVCALHRGSHIEAFRWWGRAWLAQAASLVSIALGFAFVHAPSLVGLLLGVRGAMCLVGGGACLLAAAMKREALVHRRLWAGLMAYGLWQLGAMLHAVGVVLGWWSVEGLVVLVAGDLVLEAVLGAVLVASLLSVARAQADEGIAGARKAEGALRAQENRSRRLIENVSDVIATVDSGGVFRYASPSVQRVLGYEPARYVGMRDEQLLHPDDLSATQAAFAEAFEAPERVHRVVARCRHRDGSFRTLESVLNRLPLGEGPVELVVTSRDISERRTLEQKLAEVQRLDGLGRLAGGVAHDFNNLLTVIVGAVSSAKAGLAVGHPLNDELDEIAQASTRATALTRQLLAFARQQRVDQPRVLDLNHLVEGLAKMLRRLIGESIELVGPGRGHPALVRADPGQLEQVIVNLAVNARDAMPSGGRLTLELVDCRLEEPELPPGDYVDLPVRDTGTGIAEHLKDHLFEPFFTTKALGKGTGLGLATSYAIVRQHGGCLFFENAERGGTRFHVVLPRAEEGLEPATVRPPEAESGQGEVILLVEDDGPVRTTAARVLRGHGYQVLEAANGEEALPLALESPGPELVLTDLVMPRLGGLALARRLKGSRPELKVAFTTGYSEQEELGQVRREDLLAKPFEPTQLLVFVWDKLRSPPS